MLVKQTDDADVVISLLRVGSSNQTIETMRLHKVMTTDAAAASFDLTRQRELQPSAVLQRIYFINLEKNTKRRAMMEQCLGNQPKSRAVPFFRVNATVGITDKPDACVKNKQKMERCRGISGLAMTEVDIIQNYNTSGLTLVLEDDFCVDMEKHLQKLD